MELETGIRLVTRIVTVSPSRQRSSGAGSCPFIAVALRRAPVKLTSSASIDRSNSVPMSAAPGDAARKEGQHAQAESNAPLVMPCTKRRLVETNGIRGSSATLPQIAEGLKKSIKLLQHGILALPIETPGMLIHYLRLILFAIGLLVGVQVPGFVDQYAMRVSAHQIEAARNFRGFQENADQYFGGSVEALVEHHEGSGDKAFKNEGRTIREMFVRLSALSAEVNAMRAPLIQRIIHVAVHPNREILDETLAAYSYTVPLNPSAVICGVVSGTVLAILVEAIFAAFAHLLRPIRIRPT